MKKLKLILFFATFTSVSCFCQLQNRYWYFGTNAGIDFGNSLNNPISIAGIGNTTSEGLATISDQSGNFLFFTDGLQILKGLNTPISATLNGNSSSTQSAIIVPAPNSCDLFYVFTVSNDYSNSRGSKGLEYVILDKSNWNVSSSISLESSCREKVTAVPHTNGTDYWILSTVPHTDSIVVALLTSSGISNPNKIIVSNMGGKQFDAGRFGYMKSSQNGKLLAIATGIEGLDSRVDLITFDPTNGLSAKLLKSFDAKGAYGVEFSPSGNNLFVSGLGSKTNPGCYLYCFSTTNLNLTSSVKIMALSGGTTYTGGALQLGPNGVIYLAQHKTKTLGTLNNTDNQNFNFSNANFFNQNGLVLNCNNCNVELGLPNLLPRFNTCKAPITFDPCCPPMNSDLMKTLFKIVPTGTIADPYKIGFSTTPLFTSSSQAYCNYVKTLYPSINRLTYEWRLYKAGNGNTPVVTWQGADLLPQGRVWNWFVPQGNGTLQSTTNFFDSQLVVNEWYRVHVGIFTEPASDAIKVECTGNSYFFIRIQVQNGMRKAQISDGKNIVAEMNIDPNSKKN